MYLSIHHRPKACFQAICNLHVIVKEKATKYPSFLPHSYICGLGLFTMHKMGAGSIWCFPVILSSIKINKIPAFQHLLPTLCIHRESFGVVVEIKMQVSGQNSPWGPSPAAAGVDCVFFWPLKGHCDKSDTGLLQRGAVESQTDRRMVSFQIGTSIGTWSRNCVRTQFKSTVRPLTSCFPHCLLGTRSFPFLQMPFILPRCSFYNPVFTLIHQITQPLLSESAYTSFSTQLPQGCVVTKYSLTDQLPNSLGVSLGLFGSSYLVGNSGHLNLIRTC